MGKLMLRAKKMGQQHPRNDYDGEGHLEKLYDDSGRREEKISSFWV